MRYDDSSDAALVRAADSDPEAFSALYERHVGAVYAWLRRRIEWAASDLTAETFARAWLSRGRFRNDRDGSALPWLLGIATNLLADAARDERIETRARERLGLPPTSRPRTASSRSSCGSSKSSRTSRSPNGSRSVRRPPACACPGHCAGSPTQFPRRKPGNSGNSGSGNSGSGS